MGSKIDSGPRLFLVYYDTTGGVLLMSKFEKLFEQLKQMTKSANISCRDFTGLLKDLGFEIVDCRKGGHKLAQHPLIPLTESTNYNCGHNQGAAIKQPYIKKIYRVVELYKKEIEENLQ